MFTGIACLVQVELETPREKVKLPELASEIQASMLFVFLYLCFCLWSSRRRFIKVTAEPSALRVATEAMPTFRMRRRPTTIWTNLLFDYSLPLLLATLGRLHLQPISMLKGLLQRVVTIFQLHYLFIAESARAHSTEFKYIALAASLVSMVQDGLSSREIKFITCGRLSRKDVKRLGMSFVPDIDLHELGRAWKEVDNHLVKH